MNWDSLHDTLIRAARRHPPSDHVPLAFGKRIMARLGSAERDDWPAVARALWWAAGACTAVAVAVSVWTLSPDRADNNFTDDLEQTILASAVDADPETEFEFLW